MEENRNYCDDEIDLRELFGVIWKRKKIIILITFLFTALSVAYALIKTPIYEVKSNIKIGYIGNNLIDKPGVIVKTLKVIYHVDEPLKKEKFISKVSNVSTNKKLKDFIIIKTEAISNDESLKKNKEVVKYLQELYEPKIKQYKIELQNQITSLNNKIYDIENFEKVQLLEQIQQVKNQEIKKIDEKIKFYNEIEKQTLNEKIKFYQNKLTQYENSIKQIYTENKNNEDKVTATISAVQIVNYQNLILDSQNKLENLKLELEKIDKEFIPDLERKKTNITNGKLKELKYKLNVQLRNNEKELKNKIANLKYKLTEQYISNSKVIGDYIVNDYPIKPKKKLIVVVGFVTGFMFSIFLVLMLNYFKNEENEVEVK